MEYKQGEHARMDESLGERGGKESGKKQSYKSRRDESVGMKGFHKDHKMGADIGHAHQDIAQARGMKY